MDKTNIYFIGSVELGAVKIGRSNDPIKRLSELQTGNPYPLVLFKVIEDVTPNYEIELHNVLDHIRMSGEWFKLTDELLYFMLNDSDKVIYDFKTKLPNLDVESKPNYLEEFIDHFIWFDEQGNCFLREVNLFKDLRKYLICHTNSSQFDIKKFRQLMESKGMLRTRDGSESGYMDYYVASDYLFQILDGKREINPNGKEAVLEYRRIKNDSHR